MFGVAINFGAKNQKSNESAPSGCVKCNCSSMLDCDTITMSTDMYMTEYIEEEFKRVATWASQKPRCGLTQQGAKYIQVWFHPASAIEAPISVRQIKPHFDDGEWIEPWHVSKWTKFEDPYTRSKCRFRIWRRTERTKLKPPPKVEEEPTKEEEEEGGPGGEDSKENALMEY